MLEQKYRDSFITFWFTNKGTQCFYLLIKDYKFTLKNKQNTKQNFPISSYRQAQRGEGKAPSQFQVPYGRLEERLFYVTLKSNNIQPDHAYLHEALKYISVAKAIKWLQ